MRKTTWVAVVCAVLGTAAGVGAVDHVPFMDGSPGLKALTTDVISSCNAAVSASIAYRGAGNDIGQDALFFTQGIAPMTRALNSNICPHGSTTTAEALVIGLEGVDVVGDSGHVCTGITHTGPDGGVTNDWRATLRMVYAGMGPTGTDILTRDCNQQARKDLVNNWDAIFQEDCSTKSCQTDSHPNFAGVNPNIYDATDAIKEPGLRHAFRREEDAEATDVFLGLLNLPTINFETGRPGARSNTCSAAENTLDQVFHTLSNSIFCNVHRPSDTYPPTYVPANVGLAEQASFMPDIQDLGYSPCSGGDFRCPEDGGTAVHLPGWDNDNNPATPPRWVVPNLARNYPEMQDQDPIRRKCVGTNEQTRRVGGVPTPVNLPTEQVCNADGQLGVVLVISPPSVDSGAYHSFECAVGKSDFGPAVTTATGAGVRCPNGEKAAGAPAQCRLPQRADGSFDCLNRGGLWTSSGFTGVGGPGVLDDPSLVIPTKPSGCPSDITVGAPAGTPVGTRARADVDGRVYNLVLRDPDTGGHAGEPLTVARHITSAVVTSQVPLIGSFYRIHTNRSLLNGTTAGNTPLDKTCTKTDAGQQIGCLVQASPCSLGYAGFEAADNNPGTVNLQVNGVTPSITNIQSLVTGSFPAYPIARKLYINSLRGFDNPLLAPVTVNPPVAPNDQTCVPAGGGACTVAVPSVNPTNCDLVSSTSSPRCCCDDSQPPGTGPDLESSLVSCFRSALPDMHAYGFISLPGGLICEDFNETATCGGVALNTDACAGNVLIPAGNCGDSLIDGAETDVDCGGVTCSKCSNGRRCVLSSDCTSGNCGGSPKVCQP